MKFIGIITIILGFNEGVTYPKNVTMLQPLHGRCGRDKSSSTVVYPGYARVETYPWLGMLYYTSTHRRYSTSVVLVTTQIVISAAIDIDRLPRADIRSSSRVILGANCTRKGIGVKDYSYHPDFNKATYSALAIIQLETRYWMTDLTPICPPPALTHFRKPQFYAMTLSDDCTNSRIKIHKMSYFDQEKCKMFYRKSELDVEKLWPTHTICAKAQSGPKCVWENGAVLAMRQDNRWHLLGFGIHGPGCSAPARFLNYVSYRPWVRSSWARIGQPTVSRLAENHLVLRRSLTNVQRFGPCDPEEVKAELYTDRTLIRRGPTAMRQRVSYNFTIFANMEYSCISFRSFVPKTPVWAKKPRPYIRLIRWCLSRKETCYSTKHLQINFSIEIFFQDTVWFSVMVYGREFVVVNRKSVMSHINKKKPYVTILLGSD